MSDIYMIGAGYDVPLDELQAITSLPGSGEKFAEPRAIPLYSSGQKRFTLARGIYTGGFASVIWRFGILYYVQWAYLSSTYCGGGLSGEVTINTTLNSTSFSRQNAIMQLKDPIDMQAEYWYKGADALFSLTGAAA
jgi:hypothetical protein